MNTKARTEELTATARQFLDDQQVALDAIAVTPTLVKAFEKVAGVSTPTAKRHLARAARLRRGEAVTVARGGARPGAGRPPATLDTKKIAAD